MTFRVLLLVAPYENTASTVGEHISSIIKYSKFEITEFRIRNPYADLPLNNFDAIIIHYSLIAFPMRDEIPLSISARQQISTFKGVKVAFVQDEQRAVLDRIEFLNSLGVNHLFSCVDNENLEIIYPSELCNFSKSTVLTGYVTSAHKVLGYKRKPLAMRNLDVIYRGRNLPHWLGENAKLKSSITDLVVSQSIQNNFKCDVSSKERDRIYGDKWQEFLSNGKVAIGTPSGSQAYDFYGKYLEKWVEGSGEFETDLPHPRPLDLGVISPKIFEYAASGCLIAVTPGKYSAILKPGINCLELTTDLANLNEIVNFASSAEAQSFVDFAYEDLIGSNLFDYFNLTNELDLKLSSFFVYDKRKLDLPLTEIRSLGNSQINASGKFINLIKVYVPSTLLPILHPLKNKIVKLNSFKRFSVFLPRVLEGIYRENLAWHFLARIASFFELCEVIWTFDRFRSLGASIKLSESEIAIVCPISSPNQDIHKLFSLFRPNQKRSGFYVDYGSYGLRYGPRKLKSLSKVTQRIGIAKMYRLVSGLVG